MNTRHFALAAVGTGAALVLTACGGSSDSSGGSGGETIGYSTYTLSNPFFAGMAKGAKDGAKEADVELLSTNANGSADAQVSDIQSLLTKGSKCIVVSPQDTKATAPAVAAAKAKNVPILGVANPLAEGSATTIALDDYEAGTLAGEETVKWLTAKYGKPQGKVAQITGDLVVQAGTNRKKGFEDVIAKNPDIKIVSTQSGGWDTQKANGVMSTVLQANPDIDAVFAANDSMSVGASSAIKAAGKFKPAGEDGHIMVGGVDGAGPAIADVRKGIQDWTVSQNPVAMMAKAIKTCKDLIGGKSVEKNISWPAQVIGTDNIDSAEVKKYGIWADLVKE